MYSTDSYQTTFADLTVRLVGLGLIVYGFCTVLYSAWDLNVTADERIFVELGLDYLRGDMTKQNYTPPLSRWFGAITPNIVGLAWSPSEVANNVKPLLVAQTVFAYRISHVLLYLVGALFVYQVILSRAGAWSALIFATYVGLDPTLKAFSALNVTDANVAWLLALSATHLYLYVRPFQSTSKRELIQKIVFFSLACFFFGLAITAKVTALLYGPFLALAIIADSVGLLDEERIKMSRIFDVFKRQVKQSFVFVFVGFIFVLFAIWVAFLGDLRLGLENLYQIVVYQMWHNEDGHPTALFQDVRDHGYWYYFLVLHFFKTPLSIWLLFISILGLFIYDYVKGIRPKKNCPGLRSFEKLILLVFVLPFVWFVIFLSSGNIHIGIRYLLPGILLLWIGLGLIGLPIGISSQVSRWAKYGFCGLIMLGLIEDISVLRAGAYISYFNPLTPSPVINFVDSNIDWRQGLPKHLAGEYEDYKEFSGFVGDYLSDLDFGETSHIISGASQLFGTWSYSTNILLRAFKPIKSVAGHRLFDLKNGDWYRLIANERVPLSTRRDVDRFSSLSSRLIPTGKEVQCQNGSITEAINLKKWVVAEEGKKVLETVNYSDYVSRNPDLLTAFQSKPRGLDIDMWGRHHWKEIGYTELRAVVPSDRLVRFRNLMPGEDFAMQELIGTGTVAEPLAELYRVLILGKELSVDYPRETMIATVKRLSVQLGATDDVVSRHLDSFVTTKDSPTGDKKLRGLILESLRNSGISTVGDIEKLKISKDVPQKTLESIQYLRFEFTELPSDQTYYLLVEIDNNRSTKWGLVHKPSLIAALVDGKLTLLGSHPITWGFGPKAGSANWGRFVTAKGSTTLDIFLQYGAKIRNLLLLSQTCD